MKAIEHRDSVLTSKQQIDKLNRPGSTYFNLNPFDVSDWIYLTWVFDVDVCVRDNKVWTLSGCCCCISHQGVLRYIWTSPGLMKMFVLFILLKYNTYWWLSFGEGCLLGALQLCFIILNSIEKRECNLWTNKVLFIDAVFIYSICYIEILKKRPDEINYH